MIIEGGAKPWRFDFALVPRLVDATITSQSTGAQPVLLGPSCVLIEADGFGYHKSKDAFKNDRAKQTHALKSGFVVKRITNDDARNRLDTILIDIDTILLHQRIYDSDYTIAEKGYTQSVFSWTKTHLKPEIDAKNVDFLQTTHNQHCLKKEAPLTLNRSLP